MATIKLKKPEAHATTALAPSPAPRAPVRGAGAGAGIKKARPTLAQAQALRVEREARYQEQLRQRFGERAPPAFTRRDGPPPTQLPRPRRDAIPPPPQRRDTAPHTPMPGRDGPDRHDVHNSSDRRDARDVRDDGGMRGMRDTRDPRDLRDTRDARGPSARPSPVNTAFGQRFEREPQRPDAAYQPAQRPPSEPPHRAQRAPKPPPDWDDREPHQHAPGSMRLSKRMSELGIASRREADEWIAQGWVRVDDQVVKELGSRVVPGQRVTVDAKAKYQQAQRVTVLINKPVGYVSGQAEDGYEPAVVLVTPQNQWREDRSGTRFLREHLRSLVPAGRLDIDSVGLLVLTQDGRVARQLVGEDSEIEKEYLVRVAMASGTKLPESALAMLRHGLDLDGEALLPAQVEWVNADQLRFVLRQGKKRQIRRMCEAVGLQVLGLKRVRIGTVMLGDLPAGQWRYLRMDEGFAAG